MLLEDLLFRRMRMGLVHQGQCLEAIPKVAQLVKDCLGWSFTRTETEVENTISILNEHMISSQTLSQA